MPRDRINNHVRARGEKPHPFFANNNGPHQFNRYFYLRVGKVLAIDVDRYRMKVEWMQGAGSPAWMPMSMPYSGPAGIIGAVPEEQSFVICGYYDVGLGKGSPFPLAYIPAALAKALQYNTSKLKPDQIANEDDNEVFRRFRQMSEGDVAVISALGGQIFVNNDVEISDSLLDSILIRQSDQSIISTSLNNFVFADGVSISSGPIMRNNLNIYDINGNRLEDRPGRLVTLEDGREAIYVVPFADQEEGINFETQYYPEYRVSVDEISDGNLDLNEINSDAPLSKRDPIVSLVMGNYAGAIDSDPDYGKILRPVVFSGRNDKQGKFDLVQCAQNKGQDEVSSLGLAYALNFHKSNAFFGVDKEGQYFVVLGKSRGDPSNKGRSMNVLALGSKKEVWGVDAAGISSDYVAQGGVKLDIGAAGPQEQGRSIDIRTDSGAYFEYGAADESGFAKNEVIGGDQKAYTDGDKEETVEGDSTLTISGLKTEKVLGSARQEVQTDFTIDILGVSSERVVKEKQCQFGSRSTTISGDDELTIQKGNRTETFQITGSKKTEFTPPTPGGIEESIFAGNRTIDIKTGNFEVSITAGSVEIANKIGSLSIGTTGNVELKGGLKVSIDAAKVDIGKSPVGKVITTTHLDYVTGAQLVSVQTVKAGP